MGEGCCWFLLEGNQEVGVKVSCIIVCKYCLMNLFQKCCMLCIDSTAISATAAFINSSHDSSKCGLICDRRGSVKMTDRGGNLHLPVSLLVSLSFHLHYFSCSLLYCMSM